ncbi:MAG: hypothetical protein JW958_11570 [Candidatus Eisenbacteria bacterium]|nr:hypothetical protein [Candidatus Eisenbacteria bacterium]
MKKATILRWALPLAVLALFAGAASAQLVLWEEDFCSVSDWSGFQASLVTDGFLGTVTADVDYGKVEPNAWTTAEFGCGPHSDSLYVSCTAVTGRFHVRIMEEVPPYSEINLLTADAPGDYAVDVSDITGWTGQKSFKVVIWVEWATPASATFDHISLVNTDGWADDFEPIAVGWRDEDTNPGYNAYINDLAGPYAIVQEAAGVDYGKVLSPVLTIDVDAAPTLTVVCVSDELNSNFVIAIQEEEGAYQYFELGRGYEAGIFVYDYQAITGWNGEHSFSIQLGVESQDLDGWAIFDSVILDCSDAPPPVSTEDTSWGQVKQLFR